MELILIDINGCVCVSSFDRYIYPIPARIIKKTRRKKRKMKSSLNFTIFFPNSNQLPSHPEKQLIKEGHNEN